MVTGLGARLDRLGGARIPLRDSRSIAAWVANNRRPRLFAPGTGAVGTVTEMFLGGDKLSLMCAPLISKDRLQGVIMFGRQESFHPADLNTVVNLSSIIAATLENVSLYQNARAERERQAAVYASASDAIAIVDERQALIEVNDAFAALVGKPQAELLGRPSYEMLAGRAASSCLLCDPDGPLARALEDGSSIPHLECAFDAPESRGALEGRMHKQRLRHIDFSVTPIAGPQGRRALLVGRDVTAAREVDQMKSGFLSMVSHELRGPLQVVNGYLDLLLDGTAGAMTGEQEGFVQRSRAGSEQLTALVDDLLLISRRDAGQFTLNRRPVDLSQTIRDMVDEMEIVAADAQVRLTLQAPPALPLDLRRRPAHRTGHAQPHLERDQVHASRRLSHSERGGERAGDHTASGRHRHWHPAGRPGENLRPLLPDRRGGAARAGRRAGTGPRHRAHHRRGPRWNRLGRERARTGQRLHRAPAHRLSFASG